MNQMLNPFAQPHFMISQESGPYLAPLIGFFVIAMLVGWLGASTAICRYTGLTRGKSALIWMLAIVFSIGLLLFERASLIERRQNTGNFENFTSFKQICVLLLPMLALPFVVRLYRKLIRGHLTEAEKLSGMDGVRAWLSVGNLICASLIPICAWQVFQVSLLAMFALTFGLVLAYPVFNLASAAPQTEPAAASEDLSNEREKVLQLLEAGKINAEESAELLNALGHSVPTRPLPTSEQELSPQRKIVLLGAALLLVGFFLPWFTLNPNALLNGFAEQFQQMLPANALPEIKLPNGALEIHAGNIAHGLGWWILALGIGAAGLPFFATTLNATLQKKIILAALAIGAFLLIYLLSDAFRCVSVGIILALAGFALEIVGTLKEQSSGR